MQMGNPFLLLLVALIIMAGFILAYSLIIYAIWNLAIVWLVHLPHMPFLNAIGLGIAFYVIQLVIHKRKQKKLRAELEEKAIGELRRFFDGEGK